MRTTRGDGCPHRALSHPRERGQRPVRVPAKTTSCGRVDQRAAGFGPRVAPASERRDTCMKAGSGIVAAALLGGVAVGVLVGRSGGGTAAVSEAATPATAIDQIMQQRNLNPDEAEAALKTFV